MLNVTEADHLDALGKFVQGFAALGDNWDGYGAVPPSSQTIANVLDLLGTLPGKWRVKLHQDGLTPSPYGTITLEWERKKDWVAVEVGDTTWAITMNVNGKYQGSPNETYPTGLSTPRIEEAMTMLYLNPSLCM